MTENPEVTAAATGAAAAVAAVQDDQAEAERQSAMELETVAARDAAAMAAEQAAEAAQAAGQAAEQASQAGSAASSAVEEVYSAQADIASLRTEVREGWVSFRTDLTSFLDEKLGSKEQSEQPTEVVVTDDERSGSGTDNTSESRTDGRSAGGPDESGNTAARRHRFGR